MPKVPVNIFDMVRLVHGPTGAPWSAVRLAVVATNKIKAGQKDDWALLILDEPLGEKYGRLKFSRKSPEELLQMNGRMASVGYPNAVRDGKEKLLDPRCSLRGVRGGVYFSDCGVSPGGSGGPILLQDPAGEYVVVSVLSGQCRPKGCEPVYGQAMHMDEYADVSVIIYDYYDRILKIVDENE